MYRFLFFIAVFLIIGLSAYVSMGGSFAVSANILLGLLIILVGLLGVGWILWFRKKPFEAYNYPEAWSSHFLLRKILKSHKGKLAFKYFFIPGGFISAILVILYGVILIARDLSLSS